MVPLKLTLRNFMSYGEEPVTVDFAGLHLAVLSGDNGNGKSALLDAITWALWGKTRASGSQASTDDDLVRIGADDAQVTLDFRVGDETYRVTRRRSRATRTGEWRLSAAAGPGEWRAVGSSLRETERNLIQLLRMEYETFLNSAYLQQGKADEFTRQKPDDRKRILGDILDLGRYDQLEAMARDRRAAADMAVKELDGEIRVLEAQVGERDRLGARLEGHVQDAARLHAAVGAREAEAKERHAEHAALVVEAQALAERVKRLAEVEADLRDRTSQAADLEAAMERDGQLLAEADTLQAAMTALQAARATADRLAGVPEQRLQAERRVERLRGRLAVLKQELEGALRAAEEECRQAEARGAQRKRLQDQVDAAERSLGDMADVEPRAVKAQADLATAQAVFTDLQTLYDCARKEEQEVREVLVVLAEPRAACPVCTSDLSEGRREAVLARQQAALDEILSRQQGLRARGKAARADRDRLTREAEDLQRDAQKAAAARAQVAAWRQTLSELAIGSDADAPARRDAVRKQLESGQYGADERAAVADLEREALRLNAEAADLARAQDVVRDLTARGIEARHALLAGASERHAQAAREVERFRTWRTQREGQIAAEQARLQQKRAALTGLAEAEARAGSAEAALLDARAAHGRALQEEAATRGALEECARAEVALADRRTRRAAAAHDKQAYADLAAAFGRKGVQAHIIENVLPEVTDEANRILERITDHAMSVSLHTVRALKSGGGQAETLDIRISDDSGSRPYEMYSGGEAFRANFALRIALSRLLARRAGARLQTLILDEGFGTQDARGRERLVEAIGSIRDEFDLVLVISHIEDLKDAFPSRIEVSKIASGSYVTVTP